MKLTTYTDFGLRALLYLACQPSDQLSSIAQVAGAHQVSRNHMVKVMAHLAQLGVVHSIRGKNGGIRLAKPATEINIGEVVRALENNLEGIDCNSPGCRLIGGCCLQGILKGAVEAFLQELERFTLADIIGNDAFQQQLRQTLEIDTLEAAV